MKALVKTAATPGNLGLMDRPEPSPRSGEVKIEVKAAGICGSDIHILHCDIKLILRPPVTIGHEFAGVVVEIGEGVTTCKVGDRVTSETAYSFCGCCDMCRSGFYNMCPDRKTLGYWHDGAFAKYTVVPQERIHILPDDMPFSCGAMIEPLACVTHAIYDMSVIHAGDVVLVSGPGAIGIMACLVAKAQGARVIVSGTRQDELRLQFAKELGIDYVADTEELPTIVNDLTNGRGAHVVLECSGSVHALNSGLELCKKRGYFVQVGMGSKAAVINLETLQYREIHMSASLGSHFASWNRALELTRAGKVDLRPLVSHIFSLNQWERAFAVFEKKEGYKIMLIPE